MEDRIIRIGQNEFKINLGPHNIVAIAVQGHGEHYRSHQACAYVVHISWGREDRWLWGYGSARNTETFYHHAIDAAYRDLLSESQENEPFLEAFVLANGFIKSVQKHVPYWLKNNGKKKDGTIPDSFEEMKQVYLLTQSFKLQVSRLTPHDHIELKKAKEAAGHLARHAFKNGANRYPGLRHSGETRSIAAIPFD